MLKEQLLRYDGTKEMIESCVEIVKKSDGIVIFGAGVGGKALYNLLKSNGLDSKICAWSDNNQIKWGKKFLDDRLDVIEPQRIMDMY